MTAYTISINENFKSTEIKFAEKPAEEIRAALKELRFRWHKVRGVWYGYEDAETVRKALETVEGGNSTPAKVEAVKKASAAVVIDLDNLGENKPSLYGAELAKAIREDLKRRGVKGCTVRSGKATYTTTITVTIKATPDELASLEEIRGRYPFGLFCSDTDRGFYDGEKWVYNFYELTEEEKHGEYEKYIRYTATHKDSINERYFAERRADYWTFTTAFYNKVAAALKIANQWNYDNSDIMTDYFDVGYYLDIEIKMPDGFEPREEMTEEERTAYKAEKEAEAAEEERRLAEYQRQQIEAEEARKAYEEQREKDRRIILDGVTVEDLPESEQIFVNDLAGGIGKECNLEELEEYIESHMKNPQRAIISRKVTFTTAAAFETFGKYLLDDFDFLDGMGGTASEDVRLDTTDYFTLNEEQRESVSIFMVNCVGFYVGGELVLVSDPEGYSYSRYTYKPTATTKTTNAAAERARMRGESESKPAFYNPAPIIEQAENLKPGEDVTIYQADGWILNNIYGGSGQVVTVEPGEWAQYSGVYVTLRTGAKLNKVFLRDNKKTLVYSGLLPSLPDSITKRYINDRMYELLNAGELFPRVLDYYGKQGKQPIIDTIQR